MRILTLVILLSAFFTDSFSQQQVPGSDFETWNQNHYNTSYPTLYYWEVLPTNIWASSNAATTIVNSFCMQRSTDVHSGSYAAYLETKNVFGQIAAGNLFTGYFIADLFNSKAMRGIPFTSRPQEFRGFYKYTSVSYTYGGSSIPDSCAIYAILSKWNGSQRVEIGKAEMFSSTNLTTYTQFVLPFNYSSSDTPDTISVVFASSKNGEFFRGGVGSKLYIDDISFSYLSGIDNNKLSVENCFTENQWTFSFNTMFCGELSLNDISGKEIFRKTISGTGFTLDVHSWKKGIYCYKFSGNGETVSGKIVK
jgi:hypothetical protein